MNKLNVFLAAIAFSLGFSSCETSKTPISELSSLVEKVEDRYDEFTDEDWEKIEEELSKYDYSEEDLKEIGKLKGRIFAKMTKNAVKDFSKQIEDLGKQIEGGVEGFFEELKED